MGIVEVISMNELRAKIERIEDLIIIYERHGIENRVQSLCEKTGWIQEEINRLKNK